jgi:hypothetical protein
MQARNSAEETWKQKRCRKIINYYCEIAKNARVWKRVKIKERWPLETVKLAS